MLECERRIRAAHFAVSNLRRASDNRRQSMAWKCQTAAIVTLQMAFSKNCPLEMPCKTEIFTQIATDSIVSRWRNIG